MRSIPFNRCGDRRRAIARALIAGALLSLPCAPWSRAAGVDDERNAAATGDDVNPEARRLSARGRAHFDAGRYDDAIADFTASYRIVPLPGLLYNLAQAYRLKADCVHALGAYRQFLATNPPGKIRQKAEARIVEIEPHCSASAPAAPAAPARFLPAPSAAPEPATPSSAAAPAAAAPSSAASAPVARAPVAPSPPARGTGVSDALARSLTVSAPPPPPPLRSTPSSRTRRWVGGAGFGLAAVACGVSSAYFAGQARDAAGDVSAIMHLGGTWDAAAMQRQGTGLRDEKLALILGTGALVSAALSLWFFVRLRGGG